MKKIYSRLLHVLLSNFSIITILLILTSITISSAALRTTIMNGNWTNPNTWDCGCVPLSSDDVVINHSVSEIQNISVHNMTINPSGSLYDLSRAKLTVSGNISIHGDFYYSQTELIGNTPQLITNSSGKSFEQLIINTSGADVVLNDNINVFDSLFLINGDIILGPFDLSLGSNNISGDISGGGTTSYIHTDGGGVVKRMYTKLSPPSSVINFQIGDGNIYSPVTVTINNATFLERDAFISIKTTNLKHPSLIDPDYLQRYWTINSYGVTTIEYEVVCIYDDADIVGNENNIESERWNGASWFTYNPVDAMNNILFNAVPITEIPADHDFTGGGSGGVMPIELLNFTAKPNNNNINISWSTAIETNNDFFTLEKSQNGEEFKEVTTIQGAGNSTVTNHYSFTDQHPFQGISYYRLKQTDFNGSAGIFPPVSVNLSITDDLSIKVFPNPALYNQSFNVQFNGFPEDEEILVILLNQLGKEVYSKVVMKEGSNVLTAIDPAQKLPCGLYFVIGSSNNEIYKQKMIITRPNEPAACYASF